MSYEILPGVSGMSLYVPRLRVSLERWCEWTGAPWSKVQAVVGDAFRLPAPDENVYTMAAAAALKLIQRYDIDPARVGYLGLGTESSTDNSAGAVIVRGMLDRALERLGKPRLARGCEVPELKHACLGGIYALKGALRYARCEGQERQAIVVCADVAEYERGSSGEQTQGAGAVAMLVEAHPRLFEVNLAEAASTSGYRGPDFRKPAQRYLVGSYAKSVRRHHDFPIFSGRYSTWAYLDQTTQAAELMAEQSGRSLLAWLSELRAIFFHRPYQRMPEQALAFLWVRGLARSPKHAGVLADICAAAGVEAEAVRAEASGAPDLYAALLDGREPDDPHPASTAAAAELRRSPAFGETLRSKMGLGAISRQFGNLYTAALPAWIAAGLEEAARGDEDLAGARMLAIGYGSGDAAEALPLRVARRWREAAGKIGVVEALGDAVDLDQRQYEALHDGAETDLFATPAPFRISHLGARHSAVFQDLAVEYYDFVG
jgi:hydroxymethylglutaryl-CoA synthase